MPYRSPIAATAIRITRPTTAKRSAYTMPPITVGSPVQFHNTMDAAAAAASPARPINRWTVVSERRTNAS